MNNYRNTLSSGRSSKTPPIGGDEMAKRLPGNSVVIGRRLWVCVDNSMMKGCDSGGTSARAGFCRRVTMHLVSVDEVEGLVVGRHAGRHGGCSLKYRHTLDNTRLSHR